MKHNSAAKGIRAGFKGTGYGPDPITGERVPTYPHSLYLLRMFLTIPITLAAVFTACFMFVLMFIFELWLTEVNEFYPSFFPLSAAPRFSRSLYPSRIFPQLYKGFGSTLFQLLPSITYTIVLPQLNERYSKLARRLTEFENHRSPRDFENNLVYKTAVMTSMTSYLPVLVIAFLFLPNKKHIMNWAEALNMETAAIGKMNVERVQYQLLQVRLLSWQRITNMYLFFFYSQFLFFV
jgi:hypothetical protein